MTDIKKHLPPILSCVRAGMASGDALDVLQSSLRRLLPASYGITVRGRVIDAQRNQRSDLLDVIIYDLSQSPSTSRHAATELVDRSQALLVLMLADTLDEAAIEERLDRISSVKRLATGAQTGTKKIQQLKKLLPLGAIICNHLEAGLADDVAGHALWLHARIKSYSQSWRPDYVIAQGQQLVYSNPLLMDQEYTATTMNIMREPVLQKPRPCYVCKQLFTWPHFFYRSLCLACGDLNYVKRIETVDLTGRVALVTGARVKIGYATALRLLRAGAEVIVTTRFPHDASRRYSSEVDFALWQDRLHIYGLDFRYLPVIEHFIEHLYASYAALDIIINNAAQTIRRPAAYYAHLLAGEQLALTALPPEQQALLRRSHAALPPTPFALAQTQPPEPALYISSRPEHTVPAGQAAQVANGMNLALQQDEAYFPPGMYDEHQQQLDLRHKNSWTLAFDEIDLSEFLEVQTINVTAPYLLISRLWPLLQRSAFKQRFIVNVTAAEGHFQQVKSGSHVHTNMAKAALNMLTHTIAGQLAEHAIYVNSVDPGWISQQAPANLHSREELQKLLPIDLIDAAARICDPIFSCLSSGHSASGQFFKDYHTVSW